MTTKKPLRIGVRANRLGRLLGEQVVAQLQPHLETYTVSFVTIEDSEGKVRYGARWPGVALEQAVAGGTVDIAVQNLKDIPLAAAENVVLAAVTQRFTPFDVLIARDDVILDE